MSLLKHAKRENKVIVNKATPVNVAQTLKSMGYVIGTHNRVKSDNPSEVISILRNTGNAYETNLFGFFNQVRGTRSPCLGLLCMTPWRLDVYGRKNMDEMIKVADAISREFGIHIIVQLDAEKQLYQQLENEVRKLGEWQ